MDCYDSQYVRRTDAACSGGGFAMIACGRMIKKLYPEALTVFVGPCLAKKKEAREEDVQGAVDYVLTFQEMQDIFEAADIRFRRNAGR